jgi:hypothetical protein
MFDSKEVDERGKTCEWYNRVFDSHPYICQQPRLQRRCPVTCPSLRECNDGSILHNSRPVQQHRPFQIFDRVMWLKPRQGARSLLCPRRDLSLADEIAKCEASAGQTVGSASSFENILQRTHQRVTPTDVRNCSQLAAAWDAEQCSWDGGWEADFAERYQQTRAWSVSFWAKPVAESTGMRNAWWFAINMFASLSPPVIISHWNENSPELEPRMDAISTVRAAGVEADGTARASVWPTSVVDFTDWTFFHMSLAPSGTDSNSTFRLCATLNFLPLDCTEVTSEAEAAIAGGVLEPTKLLAAIEVTSELLLSPIQVSAQALTPAQVQRKYYERRSKMELLPGPRGPESDRKRVREGNVRELGAYDQRIALLAPPLLVQVSSRSRSALYVRMCVCACPVEWLSYFVPRSSLVARVFPFCGISDSAPSHMLLQLSVIDGEQERLKMGACKASPAEPFQQVKRHSQQPPTRTEPEISKLRLWLC